MNGYNDIIGQEDVKRHLRGAVGQGKVSHAYIFSGPDGMGKGALARAFAKTLQCLEGGTEPCGICLSCRAFDNGNHPDVFNVLPAKTKSLGVDDARAQIVREMETAPYAYRYKVFIVPNADSMTSAAQNALLKTLEEPPPFCVFLFLANGLNGFLPTILSRCSLLRLRPLPPDIVEKTLAAKGADTERAAFFAAYARGNLGLAERLMESEAFADMRGDIAAAAEKAYEGDCAEALALFPVFEKHKDMIDDALELLLLLYRDAMAPCRAGSGSGFGRDMPVKDALTGFYAVLDAKRALKYNANFQMTIEVMLMKMSRLYGG